jgi:hypothetical protein
MKKSDEWAELKKPWLMSLRIPPVGVLSYIPSCKTLNRAAVFAGFTAKLRVLSHADSACGTVLKQI